MPEKIPEELDVVLLPKPPPLMSTNQRVYKKPVLPPRPVRPRPDTASQPVGLRKPTLPKQSISPKAIGLIVRRRFLATIRRRSNTSGLMGISASAASTGWGCQWCSNSPACTALPWFVFRCRLSGNFAIPGNRFGEPLLGTGKRLSNYEIERAELLCCDSCNHRVLKLRNCCSTGETNMDLAMSVPMLHSANI